MSSCSFPRPPIVPLAITFSVSLRVASIRPQTGLYAVSSRHNYVMEARGSVSLDPPALFRGHIAAVRRRTQVVTPIIESKPVQVVNDDAGITHAKDQPVHL